MHSKEVFSPFAKVVGWYLGYTISGAWKVIANHRLCSTARPFARRQAAALLRSRSGGTAKRLICAAHMRAARAVYVHTEVCTEGSLRVLVIAATITKYWVIFSDKSCISKSHILNGVIEKGKKLASVIKYNNNAGAGELHTTKRTNTSLISLC